MFKTYSLYKIFTISSLLLIVFITLPGIATATTMSPVRLELSANPGETIQTSVKVINETQNSEVLYTATLNFEPKGDESGEPNFISTRDGLAAWTKAPNSITLGPKEQKTIPVTIQIPADTEPGGYFGAIFTSSTPPKENGGGNVMLTERVGSLILLRVNGNLADSGDILEFNTKDKSYWHTFLPVNLYYRFQNSGLDRVRPLGDVLIKNWFGRTTKIFEANPEGGNVLPKSIRRFNLSWNNTDTSENPAELQGFWTKVQYQFRHFAFGPYTIQLNLAYGTGSLHAATASVKVFMFPWQLVLVSTISILLAFFILRFCIRRYNRWIIGKASKAKR